MSTVESEVIDDNAVQEREDFREGADRPPEAGRINGLVVGTLIGFAHEGHTPLVLYPGQVSSAAVAAASITDVHGAHIGRQVALMFEDGDPSRPLIMGVLGGARPWALSDQRANVTVEADGARLIVDAKEQLVLRCGKASITLTKAGKVLIQGAYVSSRSSGVNRVTGGSIQLN